MNNELKILQFKHISNLYDWYNFPSKETGLEKDANVLILGDAGESLAINLSKRVKSVVAYLNSEDLAINYKYLKLPENIDVYCRAALKNKKKTSDDKILEDILTTKKFDYILCTSIDADFIKERAKTLYDFISYLNDNFLVKDGELLMAFDNNRSIEAIAGEKLEIDKINYNITDIDDAKNRLDKSGKTIELYYPMPEYRFPIRLYSEAYEPHLEDEDKKTRNLVALNKYREYARSYILICRSKNDNNKTKKDFASDKILYIKYNIDRIKKYALRTSIVEDEKKIKYVIKKALYNEANDHVENMVSRLDKIDNKFIEMVKPIKIVSHEEAEDGKAYIVYPYIEGESLTNVIMKEIESGKDMVGVIDHYLNIIIGKHSGLIKTYNLDSTFNNCLVKDNKIYVIDGEWIDDNGTEVDFLRYRILKYFYMSEKQDLDVDNITEFVRLFGISTDDITRFEEVENNFQSLVHENIDLLDTKKYQEARPGVSELYLLRAENDRIKDKLNRITGEEGDFDIQYKKQSEVLRLTNVHVTNLENIIKAKDDNITELYKALDFYKKKESIIWKILSKIKKAVMSRLNMENPFSKILKYIYRTIRHPFKMLKTFFTKEGRNRIVGDFLIGDAYFESGKISFPKAIEPKVSIVIPCYNQISYTYKCLKSIMQYTDASIIPYEVILADDNSTDTTKNISRFVDNIIVSRNEENLGFLKNCNKAANLANGQYIYFLNNDTEVTENYLSSLVSLIEREKNIGMVGSKLVYPDGTLQEAGGIIFNDGTGANYGRNQDPGDYKYNYVKDVDYISGASIMIKKSLWGEIGGFDERYTPAYCEDSDLAFEVRKRGFRVVYEPKSVIVHYEGKSCGTNVDDASSIKSYQAINNEKLKDKWQNELLYQSPVGDFYRARERSQDKKIVLFIDHYVPTWDKDAGSKTTFAYIKMLINRGYQVKFMGDNFNINSPYGDILEEMGVEVLYGTDIQTNVWEYFKENRKNIDIVYLNRPHIATKYIDYIKANTKAKVIYYGHDLHFLRLKREYEINGDTRSLNESKYYRALEYSLVYKSDMSYYPSNVEIEEIKSVDEKLRCKAIQAYIFDEVSEERYDFSKRKNILFVGGFSHDPNVDAIKWFDEAIYPRIKSRRDDIKLVVVGSNAPDDIKAICEKDYIDYRGYVTDEELDRLYDEARIVIAPLRYGAGIKGKIIEAMAKGAAIITTDVGAEGITNAKKYMKIVNGGGDFANAIVKLYDDTETLENMSIEARRVINNRFTEESAYSIIKDDFE